MRIAIIHFGKSGAGPVFSLEMAKALNKLGHEILYYASEQVENKRYVDHESFEKKFYNTYTSKISYLKSICYPKVINRITKDILIDNPDVVYSTMNDLWIPFIFPKLKGILRVKTIHDVGVHEGNNSLFNKIWNKSNFKSAEKYVILSHKYIDELEKRGIKRSNVCVIPHPGFEYYCNICNNNNSGFKSDILFFGRIDKYKGISVLLDAMKIVISKHPSVKLNIVGKGDLSKYSKDLDALKRNITVYNRWIKDEEVAEFVSQTKFIVIPYTHATQSGVIPLAYAFSKPVISTDVGCLSEQVIDGETGFLVSYPSSEMIADAIIAMLKDEESIIKMGKSAHEFMLYNLTWGAAAEKLVNFIIN